MRSLIDIVDFTKEELKDLMDVAIDIEKNPSNYSEKCKGKKLATLFFEPSTRTRLSFEAAMLELGGSVIGFSSANSSSAAKGESYADTAKVISCYADIIAMRSPVEGSSYVASINASIPVINAGDGGHCHPTQTLADLLTIYKHKGGFDNLVVGFCGDLKYGRTVHSLIGALSRYKNVKIVLISPKELVLPDYIKEEILDKNNMEYIEVTSLEENIDKLDILYMTRIQRERFDDKDEYERLKNSYVLDVAKMEKAKESMYVLHPLPRVNEISVKVDSDPRAVYFEQCLNGKLMRMSLILKLLEEKQKNPYIVDRFAGKKLLINKYKCTNKKCISKDEQELDQVFKVVDEENNICRCIYCDKLA